MITFYLTKDNNVIKYNSETEKYVLQTTTDKNRIVSKEDFALLSVERIKKVKAFELINTYFRTVKHRWIYEGVRFRKLDAFEKSIPISQPLHACGEYYHTQGYLVYHNGSIFYACLDSDGRYYLICPTTKKFVKRTSYKNLCPVFNMDECKIC